MLTPPTNVGLKYTPRNGLHPEITLGRGFSSGIQSRPLFANFRDRFAYTTALGRGAAACCATQTQLHHIRDIHVGEWLYEYHFCHTAAILPTTLPATLPPRRLLPPRYRRTSDMLFKERVSKAWWSLCPIHTYLMHTCCLTSLRVDSISGPLATMGGLDYPSESQSVCLDGCSELCW